MSTEYWFYPHTSIEGMGKVGMWGWELGRGYWNEAWSESATEVNQ